MTTFLIVLCLWYIIGIISGLYWLRKFGSLRYSDYMVVPVIGLLGPLAYTCGLIASRFGESL